MPILSPHKATAQTGITAPASRELPSLTPGLADSIRISWLFSYWCNYQCDYCGVPVFSRRDGERQAHAFDYYPAEEWLAAFLRIRRQRVLVKITGGEPFVDRANWKKMLGGLLGAERFEIEVFTNCSWNVDYFLGLPHPAKLHLVASFHAGQTRFEPWRARLLRIRDAGFTIVRALTVLAPENLEFAEQFLRQMQQDGIQASLNPMMPAGMYMHKKKMPLHASELIEREVTPAIAWMHTLRRQTKGQPCYYPAVTYDLDYEGHVCVACMNLPPANFLRDPLPQLPRAAVACPLDECIGCVEMVYSMPANPFVDHPIRLFNEVDFAADIRHHHQRSQENPNHFQDTLRSAALPSGEVDCYTAFTHLSEDDSASASVEIPLEDEFQPLPSVPVLGYLDDFQKVLNARAGDRIMVSGWAFSRNPLGPVRVVRITMDGKTIGRFEDFYGRPELCEIYGRRELLTVGYQGLVFLPMVKPGNYKLGAVAVDHAGQEHILPPRMVCILG